MIYLWPALSKKMTVCFSVCFFPSAELLPIHKRLSSVNVSGNKIDVKEGEGVQDSDIGFFFKIVSSLK